MPALHPPNAQLQLVPNPIQGQPWDRIRWQLNRVTAAPRLVPSRPVPAPRADLYNLLQPSVLPIATTELPICSGWPILRMVTNLPRPTCEAIISLRRPTHRVSLVPKLIPVRRQLSWEKPLTRHCLLITCRCLPDKDIVQRKPPRCTLRRIQPQHLVASFVTKLLRATCAPALFRCLSLPSPPQAASTPNLLNRA